MTDFSNFFNRHFEIKTDSDAGTRDEAFKLRYQVYCLERGYEDAAAFHNRREQDLHDHHSLHGIVRHRQTCETMGAVRLVRGGGSTADRRHFPIEHACPGILTDNSLGDDVLPRGATAEISRLAVSKASQCRIPQLAGGEHALARAGWRFNGRCYPLVTFGLFIALSRISIRNDITHWVAVMEPSLLRLLSRFGIRFHSIGGLIDYHGLRQPCYAEVQDIKRGVELGEQNLFNLARHDLHPAPYTRADRRRHIAARAHSVYPADMMLNKRY